MSKVIVTDHPLIQHKLTLMRDKNTGSKDFRELLTEIAMLMGYEITKDIPLKDVVGMLSWQYFIVVISVVFTVISVGFFVARFLNMNPVEADIVSACQSGMGARVMSLF